MSVPDSIYRACQRDVSAAVWSAVNAGATPQQFIQMVRECWEIEMREKTKSDLEALQL